jgi:hypothetical protein
MTHAHVDGRWMVVFYNEPGHAVRLAVNDGDWIEDETDLEPVGTGDGFKCFDISGHMQLLNLETGPVTANMAGVPHLAQISDGDEPRQEIRRRLPHGDFVGYLDINGGLLTVADWFTNLVTFDGATLQCLPRTVLWSTNSTQSTVVLSTKDGKITFHQYAQITIRNMDRIKPTPSEYQFYKKFFRNVSFLQQPTETKVPCTYGAPEVAPMRCGEPGTLGVECSNNQFP